MLMLLTLRRHTWIVPHPTLPHAQPAPRLEQPYWRRNRLEWPLLLLLLSILCLDLRAPTAPSTAPSSLREAAPPRAPLAQEAPSPQKTMRLPDLISSAPAKPMLQDAPFPALHDEQQPFQQPGPDRTLAAPPSERPVGEPAMQLRPSAAPPQMLAAYQENLDIMRKLAALDQRNVSVSLVELGDVKLQAGDQAGALAAYRESLDILRKLAAQDPGNAEAQRDLVTNPESLVQRDLMLCYSRLAGVYLGEQQLAQASEDLAAGHVIAARLVANFPDWAEGKEALGWFDQNIAALPEK